MTPTTKIPIHHLPTLTLIQQINAHLRNGQHGSRRLVSRQLITVPCTLFFHRCSSPGSSIDTSSASVQTTGLKLRRMDVAVQGLFAARIASSTAAAYRSGLRLTTHFATRPDSVPSHSTNGPSAALSPTYSREVFLPAQFTFT